MSDVRKSLEFAATSSSWSEHHCTRRHAHNFGCPSSRRRSKWAFLNKNAARWLSSLRPSATKRIGMG